jgi:hypothetical protein
MIITVKINRLPSIQLVNLFMTRAFKTEVAIILLSTSVIAKSYPLG